MCMRFLALAGWLAGWLVAGAIATGAAAAPLSAQAWPECKSLKLVRASTRVALQLGGRGRRTGFALVDDLPDAFYAFRRNARICRVQVEEGMILTLPILK